MDAFEGVDTRHCDCGNDPTYPKVSVRERYGLDRVHVGHASTYVVYGNNREKVKQYGNAWVPEVSRLIISRCIEALHPETERYDPWAVWGITA